jgi:hypothetical protein
MAAKSDPHPQRAFDELSAELRAARQLAAGYVLRGEELYYRQRALDAVKELGRESGSELCAHDGKEPGFQLSRLLDDLGGGALFAPSRLVVIERPEELLKKSDDGEESPTARAVAAFLAARAGTVVLCTEGLRADHATVKKLVAAGGKLWSFRKLWLTPWGSDDLRQGELVPWLLERARELPVKLTPEQAVFLAQATGNDLHALELRLAELSLAGAPAFFEHLEGNAPGNPFQLATELARGALPGSLLGIETLFRGGFRQKDGRFETKPDALLQILFNALRSSLRRSLTEGDPLRSREEWQAMLTDLAHLERRARIERGVDENDFFRFALRWQGTAARAR